ncbi:hypothetical protein NC661_05095 [Aquibacillus koreensis]|uniref:t-SNARE coiled-coil homology domain-containing protein n=1 Tax=Aquibacillus koreensis TaxID=279446 RepID=A0A9X4AH94_9BACI|nr:hypothetical protein [Aquibacillus koreensis]MCT2535098.1 hypothetical protein [Aquibacillus koreensis]MDC3419741.1 hypothetical protein [Aquibacillus koreensis]
MEETLKQILGELQKVNQRMDGLDKRMDGFDNRFETIDKRFDTIDNHFETIDKRFETIDNRFETIDKRFDTVDKDIKELKTGQEELKNSMINRVVPYKEEVAKHINERFDELKDSLEGQQRVIDTLSARSIKHESEIRHIRSILNNQ